MTGYAAWILMALMVTPTPAVFADSHLERIQKRGVLVAIAFPEQGNSFLSVDVNEFQRSVADPERYTGVDSELLEKVAASLGVELHYKVPERFSVNDLFEAVLAGEADIAVGAITITKARKKRLDFSRPYYSFSPVVLVREGSPIATYDDLTGKRAAVTRGSSLFEHLIDAGFAREQLTETAFAIETVLAVEEQQVDFGMEDRQISENLLGTSKKVHIAFDFPADDHYGYGMPKHSDLVTAVDAVLLELEKNGEIEAILETHLNATKH